MKHLVSIFLISNADDYVFRIKIAREQFFFPSCGLFKLNLIEFLIINLIHNLSVGKPLCFGIPI